MLKKGVWVEIRLGLHLGAWESHFSFRADLVFYSQTDHSSALDKSQTIRKSTLSLRQCVFAER